MKKVKIERTDEYIYIDKLDNGLELYMLPNHNVNKYYLTLNTRFGSINTNFKYNGEVYNLPKGIAHFLEHLAFNMENGSAFDYYSKLGSSINAFTTYDLTSYNVISNSKFKENLEYLLEYVYTPYFTKELVNNEKGIICEEVKMYKDDPNMTIISGTLNNLFVKDERKYQVGGTISDVKEIKLEQIEACYNAYYHPSNMFLVITGNFNPEEALAITKEKLLNFDFNRESNVKDIIPKEPEKINKEEDNILMNIDKPKISIGVKIPKNNFKNLKMNDNIIKLYLELILRINFGSTSLILEELKSSNIIDDLDYTIIETNEYYCMLFVASTFYPEYYRERILNKLDTLELSEEDIDRIKKVAISDYILLFDSITSVNNYIIDDIIDNKEFIPNLMDIYSNLNYDDALKILKRLNFDNNTVFRIMPKLIPNNH